jgi:hypothetical protein
MPSTRDAKTRLRTVGVSVMRKLFRAVGARTKSDERALEYGLFAFSASVVLIALYKIIA